ncbi:MAG TPA: hypothetical protein VG898_03225 [Solirubrobacterales bacterium]|nr:hypothetical protein [Solirubrobacterales bacterium]
MQQESTLGRTLWIAILVLLVCYVAADFARSPFFAQRGAAAVQAPQLTLWITGPEAGGEAEIVARQAAAGFELSGHSTVVKRLDGGSSHAVAEFLSQPRRRRSADLLVLTNSTLADLAHDRLDHLVPGAAEQAVLAQALLRRSTPIRALTADRLVVAVNPQAQIDGTTDLLEAMRSAPWDRLFAIADDSWSRVQLAALVERAGVDGEARFRIFGSGEEAGRAVGEGTAETALITRGALLAGANLRRLAWPVAGRVPRTWVALVALPGLPAARAAKLRRIVDQLLADRSWRVQQRRAGREPFGAASGSLPALLLSGATRAARLERLADRVERH